MSENTSSQVFSFEPDPRLFAKLPTIERVEWIEKAIDGSSGELLLGLGQNNCSSAVYRETPEQQTVRVRKISLDDFCTERGIDRIDFLKMDIEGAELSVLELCSDRLLQSITQLTVEFHDFLEPKDLPRIKQIFGRMQSLGFLGVRFSYNSWGDCLFLNTSHVRISLMNHLN